MLVRASYLGMSSFYYSSTPSQAYAMFQISVDVRSTLEGDELSELLAPSYLYSNLSTQPTTYPFLQIAVPLLSPGLDTLPAEAYGIQGKSVAVMYAQRLTTGPDPTTSAAATTTPSATAKSVDATSSASEIINSSWTIWAVAIVSIIMTFVF